MTDMLELLGPLRALAGVREGDKGSDLAPTADRVGSAASVECGPRKKRRE